MQNGLNEMKSLKRRLGTEKEIDKVCKAYEKVVNSIEVRDDIDFYHTVQHLCKEYGIRCSDGKDVKNPPQVKDNLRGDVDTIKSEIRGYISELTPKYQRLYILVFKTWHTILYIAPIVIFILCIIIKW